jgi:hypothetical protein
MGLSERRAVKQFQDSKFADLKKELDEAAGFDVPVEVQWDSLAKDGYAHMYEDAFTKVYFAPLRAALKAVAVDDLGRQALREGLKKVVLCSVKGSYGDDAVEFAGGVLTIDHDPVSNIDYVGDRADLIQRKLEAAL